MKMNNVFKVISCSALLLGLSLEAAIVNITNTSRQDIYVGVQGTPLCPKPAAITLKPNQVFSSDWGACGIAYILLGFDKERFGIWKSKALYRMSKDEQALTVHKYKTPDERANLTYYIDIDGVNADVRYDDPSLVDRDSKISLGKMVSVGKIDIDSKIPKVPLAEVSAKLDIVVPADLTATNVK